MSDRVILVAPESPRLSVLFTRCLSDTVQTGTGKVDAARKFKCTTATRVTRKKSTSILQFTLFRSFLKNDNFFFSRNDPFYSSIVRFSSERQPFSRSKNDGHL